mgnify:CR=1 FL=1
MHLKLHYQKIIGKEMTSKSKRKGNYHENWFVKLFNSWKLPAKKVPLSGSLGGEHTGDIKLIINDKFRIIIIYIFFKIGFTYYLFLITS